MNYLTALKFDALCVVSDLHIGGEKGFQIFSGKQTLPWLLRSLAKEKSATLGLVINGDFIDFLAEAPQRHFDAANAVNKLNRIATQDPTFIETFEALREFLSAPGRSLIVNLGNHDLELALPPVQARFEELVCADDGARGRLHWVADGTGVRVQVGKARVLCLHGNETDDWNVVAFETLRRIKLGMLRGRYDADADPDRWLPNAGTKLVIDAMNAVKRKYPFVDVLKPEQEVALKVLIALDPSLLRFAPEGVGAGLRSVWDGLLKRWRLLGDSSADAGALVEIDAHALIDEIEEAHQKGVRAESIVGEGQKTLSVGGAIAALATGKGTVAALREALEGTDQNLDFDINHEDADNSKLADFVGSEIDFLISGHTHFARSLPRTGGYHFNSGTWAYLMRITPEQRKDSKTFAAIVDDLKQCTLEQLAQKGRLITRNTVVRVQSEADERVSAALWQVESPAAGKFALNQVAASRRDI